jgi:tetratricopeptide (TPR) repeat protein
MGYFSFGDDMIRLRLAAICLYLPLAGACASAQQPSDSSIIAEDSIAKPTPRSDAYYSYALGHYFELQFEATSNNDFATKSIEAYKKAYALDPKSQIIGERLAEMYWKSQRVPEAVAEAKEILKRNANDLPARRLLGRIFLRSMGDLSAGNGQSEMAVRAIEQYREIFRLDPSDTDSGLWLARLYRLHNEPEKAGQVLRAILRDDPENDTALEQLTQLLLDQGKSSEAVSLLEGASGGSPSPVTLNLLGDAYTQTKQLAKAEHAYRQAVDLDPSELSYQRGLGQTLFSEEKYPEALVVFQKLAEMIPDDADVYLHIAQVYRELHQLDKAEQNLLKARQYAPGSLEVLYNEAMIYESQGRFEDAIRVLSDAVAGVKSQSTVLPTRRRTLAILYQQLGQLYRDTQNFQAAAYTYEEMGHLGEEEDRRARSMLAETYRTAKDLPKALQIAKDGSAKYPKDAQLRTSLALLLGENQQTEEGVKLLRPQLNGTDTDRETYLNIAQIYERGRHYKEAEEAVGAASVVPGQPRDNEMTWFLLGAIYERQKIYDRAEEQFKKVLALNPKNAPVLNYYGYMLADRGLRLDEAQVMVQRALDEEPFSGAYLDSLGWVYFKQAKFVEAEAMLRKAVARESHDPMIRSHLGDIYAKTGRGELAATEWEKSLTEWRRSLPGDVENDKVAELEKKLGQVRHHLASKSAPADAKPQ